MSDIKSSAIFTEALDYASFHYTNDHLDFTTAWNDTIYAFEREEDPRPVYVLDYGKFKYPVKSQGKSTIDKGLLKNYVYPNWKVITDKYFMLEYQYNKNSYLSIYNFYLKTFIFNGTRNNTENPGVANDIDGGPGLNWIYHYKVNDGKTLIRPIDAIDFIDHYEKSYVESMEFINKDKRKEFVEIAKMIKENDNPVIQIFTLK